MGLRPTDTGMAIYKKQNPCHDWKTGNVGIHISLDGKTHVLATIVHSFDNKSPYSLEYKDEKLFLKKCEKTVLQVKEVPMPEWYRKKTSTEIPMASIFLHEGKSFIHQAYTGCDYPSKGTGCKFCATGSRWNIGTSREIGETVTAAVNENSKYHVCLGGGTRLPLLRNIDYFLECTNEIRKRNPKVPIWIEMVPPEYDSDIERMIESGATSFGFNIELWDETLREDVCPGKSQVPIKRYIEAAKKVTALLGSNRVGSVLIVGIEPIENSIVGSDTLAANGIQPCIIPFKPWDKTELTNYSLCTPDNFINVSEKAVAAMIKNNLNPNKNQGCLLCEGCGIDHDLYDLKMKN